MIDHIDQVWIVELAKEVSLNLVGSFLCNSGEIDLDSV
jgi:hypothetical protein